MNWVPGVILYGPGTPFPGYARGWASERRGGAGTPAQVWAEGPDGLSWAPASAAVR